jgi:probable HAF family extracellular repeat protein
MRSVFAFAVRALLLLAPLLLVPVLLAPVPCRADPAYTVTRIAGPGSSAVDINSSGQLAGNMQVGGYQHGFFFSSGMLSDIGTLGGNTSNASRMNDLGQIVGWSDSSGPGGAPGFIYSGGTMAPVGGFGITAVSAINNAGTMTGTAWIAGAGGDGQYHAYTLSGGVFTDLGTVPGRIESHGVAINDAGHVAGSTAPVESGPPNWPLNPMLYRNGVMSDLGDGGYMGPWSEARAINAYDQVVGALGVYFAGSGDLYPHLAFLWQDGALKTIGSFGPGLASWASDINNLGWIVGGGWVGEVGTGHGFLFRDGSFVDLNTLIDPASGWVIQDAAAINDLGQIAGTACIAGECYAVRLDLVSAVPEPASRAMLLGGAGVFALLGVLRRPARRRRG